MTLSRRALVRGAAALPLAAILADPMLARAVAAGLDEVTIATPSGREVRAALALPDATPAAAVLLVHEWWGLNDQIRSVAADLANHGFVALAIDLYDGGVAATPDEARALMGEVNRSPGTARETLAAWLAWLGDHEATNGRLATIGWCFGGGWSLNASLETGVDATVVYYGNVARSAAELASLRGPVLGHFAERDQWINAAMVEGFEAAMGEAGKHLTAHWYAADHAFANPTSARHDEADAQLAWQRTLAFLRENLAG